MATEFDGIDITVDCATDLSAAQYHFVKISAADGRVVIASSAGEKVLGILQEPVDGSTTVATARVRVLGKSKVRLGGTMTRNDAVQSAADGEATTAASGDYSAGILLESGVDQDIKHMVVIPACAQLN